MDKQESEIIDDPEVEIGNFATEEAPPISNRLRQIIGKLQAPTPPTEIRYIPRGVKDGKAVAIPYVASEFVEGRLDEACGPFGWQSKIIGAASTIATGVGILNPDTREWLWRWDVGAEANQGEFGDKAEVTAGLKRAARQWGVARDLKDIPKLRVTCQTYKSGNTEKFVKWTEDPWNAIERFLTKGGQRGNEGGADDPNIGKSGPTPAEARKMLFDFMVKDISDGGCSFSENEANAWVKDQEQEPPAGLGKSVESYRKMYGMMVEKRKANLPPE